MYNYNGICTAYDESAAYLKQIIMAHILHTMMKALPILKDENTAYNAEITENNDISVYTAYNFSSRHRAAAIHLRANVLQVGGYTNFINEDTS